MNDFDDLVEGDALAEGAQEAGVQASGGDMAAALADHKRAREGGELGRDGPDGSPPGRLQPEERWEPDDWAPICRGAFKWCTALYAWGVHGEVVQPPEELCDEAGDDLGRGLAPIMDDLLPKGSSSGKWSKFFATLSVYAAAADSAVKLELADRADDEEGRE